MVIRLVAPIVLTGALTLAPAEVGTTPPAGGHARLLAPAVHDRGSVSCRYVDPAGLGADLGDLPR